MLKIGVRVAENFHSGKEFHALVDAARTDDKGLTDEQVSFVSGFICLKEFVEGGFLEVEPRLEKTGSDEIWIFKDNALRMALRIPADGRHQTRDVDLLVSEFCATDSKIEKKTRGDFLKKAQHRLEYGNSESFKL